MKVITKHCLRCGYDKTEKSIGCYVYGKLISKMHLYTFNIDKNDGAYKEEVEWWIDEEKKGNCKIIK